MTHDTFALVKKLDTKSKAEAYIKHLPQTFFPLINVEYKCLIQVNDEILIAKFTIDSEWRYSKIKWDNYPADRLCYYLLPTNENGSIRNDFPKNAALVLSEEGLLVLKTHNGLKSVTQHFENINIDTENRKKLGYSYLQKYVLSN